MTPNPADLTRHLPGQRTKRKRPFHHSNRTKNFRPLKRNDIKMAHCVKLLLAKQQEFRVMKRQAFTWSKFRGLYLDLWNPEPPRTPYFHVCQVGDPVLRNVAQPVDPAAIGTPEMKKLLAVMRQVMKKYQAAGLAAPQIGVSLRIIALQFTEDQIKAYDKPIQVAREMEVVPYQVFINPVMKIVNFKNVTFPEGCASILGFSASVPRHREVLISGLNEQGEAIDWHAKGWSARIAQHEMDHINGKLYIDCMDKTSFQFDQWHKLNIKGGKCTAKYS